MTPAPFHPKREMMNDHPHPLPLCPPPLKIQKGSHSIKKSSSPPPPLSSSSSSSSSSASSSLANGVIGSSNSKPQQRHPVIIYTHSPKVIHTHPRDFMALVQKLTGLSRSDNDGADIPQPKPDPGNAAASSVACNDTDHKKVTANEDNETSSVITEENNCSSSIGDTQVNSCFMTNPPILDPSLNPYMTNLPVFTPNPAELLCSNQPFLNYDSLFFTHNIRGSMNPSTATMDGMNDFRDS